MVVQKVKGLLHRLLKVPAADLKLTYTSPKVSDLKHLLPNVPQRGLLKTTRPGVMQLAR